MHATVATSRWAKIEHKAGRILCWLLTVSASLPVWIYVLLAVVALSSDTTSAFLVLRVVRHPIPKTNQVRRASLVELHESTKSDVENLGDPAISNKGVTSSNCEEKEQISRNHCVRGIDCQEVTIPNLGYGVGSITILEATASAQDALVDLALEDPTLDGSSSDDDDRDSLSLPTGDPYGAVLWPAASVVAKTLLQELSETSDKKVTILELGAGTGLVSIAAMKAGCQQVIATDYEQIPLDLLQYAAIHLNLPLSNSNTQQQPSLSCQLLDMCNFSEQPLPPVDYVVAADVMYQPSTGRAVAQRVLEALRNNSTVIVGDSPGRAGRPAFLKELQPRLRWAQDKNGNRTVDFTNVPGWTVTGPRNSLICGRGSSTVSQELPKELTVSVLKLDPTECEILS
mmetsp:Transcript_12571/g.34863  ORF Transcript_12571/g.34863 Transcript_12571/m.34863 type:complete len:399 (-) Transcript_12571:62-1258(-)